MGVLSGAPSHLDPVAKNLVIVWASSATQDGEISRAARECCQGATAVSLSVCAGRELLIAVDDFQQQWQKSFQHLDTSLAGQAARSRSFCADERLDRPSALLDVEAAYQGGKCRTLTAMPVIGDSGDVLGVVCVGLPSHVTLTSQHMQALEGLAKALAPHLQQYSTSTSATWDTSVFGANPDLQCLPGCSCACTSSDNGSAGEEEWMDFDFSAYADVMEDNLEGSATTWEDSSQWAGLKQANNAHHGSTSLDSTCSESTASAEVLRANLTAGALRTLPC